MIGVAYFSASGNTRAFLQKTGIESLSIPSDGALRMTDPFILVVPTYSAGSGAGAIPKPVRKFLNHENNRSLIRGVVASGDRNFGTTYCYSGTEIKRRFYVPVLHQYELSGTPSDVSRVREIVTQWH